MRIIYHHRTQGRGVEGVHIRGQISAFRHRGHQVEVLSPPGCDPFLERGSAGPPVRRKFVWRFISAHCPEFLFEVLELSYNVLAIVRLAMVCRPDVIYERYFLFSVAAGLIARMRGCRIVYEVNDSSVLQQRVRRLAFVRLARALERQILTRADLVVVVSRAMASALERTVGIEPHRIVVVPNAVDGSGIVATVDPVKKDSPDEVVIGFVGLFVPWHGLNLLVDAVADFDTAGIRLGLLLVGDGPVRREIEQRVSDLGLIHRVTITGTVLHGEVQTWLQRMDIAVMPDSNEYGSPMKIFEYMAAGKAIVAPDYGPILEVLEDGETGIIFRRHDVRGLRDALARLVADSGLRKRLGENARRVVIREHTWVRNAERIERALHAVGVLPATVQTRPLTNA